MTINYIGAFFLIVIGLAIIVLKSNLIKIVIGTCHLFFLKAYKRTMMTRYRFISSIIPASAAWLKLFKVNFIESVW